VRGELFVRNKEFKRPIYDTEGAILLYRVSIFFILKILEKRKKNLAL